MSRKPLKKSNRKDADAQHPAPAMPVVCVGASAGGLEALTELLKPLPPDIGAAFVIITHQHPSHTSLLPELLAKESCLPVSQASDGICLEPNHIYVNMPGRTLEIAGGHLCSSDAEAGGNRTIDHFLRLLAADQGGCSIAVILSGANNDGTLGIEAIKAAGGMVVVQQPSEAKYECMPASAIATGLADYVLSASQISDLLRDYIRGPFLMVRRGFEELSPLLPEAALLRILLCLRDQTGHDFTNYKRSTISRRIERRMTLHRAADPNAYLRLLASDPQEARLLMQELLISVTSFFRDPLAFELLAAKAIPDLLAARASDAPLRVWVPGCATGEEAYSVAILLQEQLPQVSRAGGIQLFGTDLDTHAIDVARKGLYPESISADLSPERLKHSFMREESGYRVRQSVRELLVFAVQNLLQDPPFTRLDLICCRNVLIYLTTETQRRLMETFHYSLNPGGLLFLGSSETIGEMGLLFETVDAKWKIYRRKEIATGTIPLHAYPVEWRSPSGTHPVQTTRTEPANAATHVQRMLLTRFAPPSVVVDALGNIIHVQGQTGPYLELKEGQPSSNVLQLAREGLGPALSTALRKAHSGTAEIVRKNVRVRTDHAFSRVDITVNAISEPAALRGLYLVTLQSTDEVADLPGGEPRELPATTREEDLESELQETRKSLQITIEELTNSNEELRISNEELQSTNEEMQSTNEEMETSKEELQSLNEEMNTVNAELQSKVESVAQASDDLRNLLNSTQVACVFLDEELRVKRFTKQAKELIRLVESDVGRPLEDLKTNLTYNRLTEDCRSVLDTLAPVEKDVRDTNGHWHLLRVLPYRTGENAIDGVVVTLVNIDRIKTVEQMQCKTSESRDFFESIVKTARGPLLVCDASEQVVLANDAFIRTFHACRQEVEGHPLYAVCDGLWNLPQLKTLMEKVRSTQAVVTDIRLECQMPGGGCRVFLVNARRLDRKVGLPEMILLALEEETNDSMTLL